VGYYLRAFCNSPEVPPLRQVLTAAAEQGIQLELTGDQSDTDLDSSTWQTAEIRYKPANQPLLVEVGRAGEELLADEIEEFAELLEDVEASPEREKALEHVRASSALVSVQLLGDIDDDGYDAVGAFLSYFVENCGAMIQADGEGFYEADLLVVPLD
jgi:hypothetical protein